MNDEFIKATTPQNADHLTSPTSIESKLKSLTFGEWRDLLYNFPQFAPRYYWRMLRSECWKQMSFVPQQFADSLDWVLDNGGNWAKILDEKPMLFREKCNWAELTGRNWAWLLKWKPALRDLCDWNKLSDDDRRSLLNQQQPQFKIKSETAGEDENKELHKRSWRQSDFTRPKMVSIDLLTIEEHLPRNQPSLDDLFSELEHKLSALFEEYNGFNEFDGIDWSVWLCRVSPEETNSHWHYRMQESDWDKLGGKDWVGLLRWKPNLARHCRWSKLGGSNWAKLLRMYPEFAENCDWEKTKNWSSRDWAMLIRSKPEYATFERMQLFTGSDWAIVLSRQPGLAEDKWLVKLQGSDWVSLIWSQPQFAEKCDWRKLNADDWIKLLKNQPEFSDKCKFESFEGNDIVKLAFAIPKFAGLCDLDRLYEYNTGCDNDVHSWFADLLITDGREIGDGSMRDSRFLHEIQRKCDWKKFSEQDLLWIMRKCLLPTWDGLVKAGLICCPTQNQDSCRLANATWSDLTGEDIVRLLSSFPQLSAKVDLTKLTVLDWIDLLRSQPKLINECGHLKPQIEEEMRRREYERQEQRELARERYEFENDNSFDDIEDNPYYVDGVPVYGAEDQEDADIIYWNTH